MLVLCLADSVIVQAAPASPVRCCWQTWPKGAAWGGGGRLGAVGSRTQHTLSADRGEGKLTSLAYCTRGGNQGSKSSGTAIGMGSWSGLRAGCWWALLAGLGSSDAL